MSLSTCWTVIAAFLFGCLVVVVACNIAVAISCLVLSSLPSLLLFLRCAHMIVTASRHVHTGTRPRGVASELPASGLLPASVTAGDSIAASFVHSDSYRNVANRRDGPVAEPRTIVPLNSWSTQRYANSSSGTPPAGPIRQRRLRRKPLSSPMTSGLSREAPPTPSREAPPPASRKAPPPPSRKAPPPPSREASSPPSREAPPPPTESQHADSTSEDDTSRMLDGMDSYQFEDTEQTPWKQNEIPDELALLQPGVPEEIRNIVQESMDEQRAMRLSELQARAVVVRTTISIGHGEPELEEPSMVPESSAMASRRHAVSSTSSLGTDSLDPSLNSRTSLGSSNAANNVLKPTVSGGTPPSRFSGENVLSDLNLTRMKTQRSGEKLSKAQRVLRMLRRSKDPIPTTDTIQEPTQEPAQEPAQDPAREPAMYECTSCFDDVPSKEAVKVPCQHRYCSSCLCQLIATAIQQEDQFPPKCCLQEIPRAVFKAHLAAKELASFDSKALEYSVAVGSRYYCPRPACARWIDTTKARSHNGSLVCAHCTHRMCTFCCGPAHAAGRDCPQDFGLDATLQQAERAGWRRCYNCQTLVELITGCRHITCKCKAEFWYLLPLFLLLK